MHLTLESISRQTVKPNKVILWLDENEFTLDNIPKRIINLQARGLEVKFCKNIKSYKKYMPTSSLYPDSNIITIDDDILYPSDMIEILMREHTEYPDHILGHRAHYIKLRSNNKLSPYRDWEFETIKSTSDSQVFITTGGGTLFPANCFKCTVHNDETKFMEFCGSADDVWFYSMALLNGVRCKKVKDDRPFEPRFIITNLSDDIGLENDNVNDFGNDRQLKAVFEQYNLYEKL